MKYIVIHDDTLGYVLGESNGVIRFVVMAVDYMRGGDPTLIDRESIARKSDCRDATKEDFEHFKIIV